MRIRQVAALGAIGVIGVMGCTSSRPVAVISPSPQAAVYVPTAPSATIVARPHVAAPRNFAAAATSPTSVHLTWLASSSNLTGYYLTSTPGNVEMGLEANAEAADVTGLVVGTAYSFSLQTVGEDAMSWPVSASVSTPLPTSNIISSVPQYYQLPLSCEETATSMALVNQGMHVSTQQILDGLGVDNTPIVIRGGRIVSWGNPDKAFVGNVYGSENHAPWGYQANPKALVRVLNSLGAKIIDWSEPGVTANTISAGQIYEYILRGHPVVAYATWDWRYHAYYTYTSEDGNQVPTIYPYDDHVYTVVGVNETSVLVHDPIRGTYWVSKASFEAAYEFGMAIVLQ